jgi:hypothetical protein
MAHASFHGWSKKEISDTAKLECLLQNRGRSNLACSNQAKTKVVLGFYQQRGLYVDRCQTVEEIPVALYPKISDLHNPDNCTAISDWLHFGGHQIEQCATITMAVHVHISWFELATHVLFRSPSTSLEGASISSLVHLQSISELVVHGLWNIHCWTTDLGRTESRCRCRGCKDQSSISY